MSQDAGNPFGEWNMPAPGAMATAQTKLAAVTNMKDYETGYREGESNRQADWSFALTEFCELPDDVDHEDPASVARYIARLSSAD